MKCVSRSIKNPCAISSHRRSSPRNPKRVKRFLSNSKFRRPSPRNPKRVSRFLSNSKFLSKKQLCDNTTKFSKWIKKEKPHLADKISQCAAHLTGIAWQKRSHTKYFHNQRTYSIYRHRCRLEGRQRRRRKPATMRTSCCRLPSTRAFSSQLILRSWSAPRYSPPPCPCESSP
jgi:hypothetical protein